MPTTYRYGGSWWIDPAGKRVDSGQTHIVSVDRMDRPAASRRPKPTDLFANSTARRVVSATSSYTYGTFHNAPWNKYKLTAPMTYWVGISGELPFPEPTVADFSHLDNKVRAKIKDQNVNLANAMAEYRQTSNLLFSTARDVIRTFHSLRSGRPHQDFIRMLSHPDTRNARRLANRWLEYQYGWRPLLSDIHGGAEALAKSLQQGVPLYQTATDKRSGIKTVSDIFGNTSLEGSLSMKVRVRYVISASGLKTVSELGFTNPLSLAWELVPWSFVIDWIIPVGDYLGGLDALTGVSNLTVVRSYQYKIHASRTLSYSSGGKFFSPSPRGTLNSRITNRFPVDNRLSFGSLRFEPSITATRLANAMALLRQLKR